MNKYNSIKVETLLPNHIYFPRLLPKKTPPIFHTFISSNRKVGVVGK